MTYKKLLERLQKMTPEQLNKPARLMEGCSGNWTTINSAVVARSDTWRDGEEPGTERHETLKKYDHFKPACPKGEVFLCHDH